MEKKNPTVSFFDAVWQFFASVRLSVVILLLLALTSIVGTLIPQNQSDEFYFHKFENAYQMLTALNITDMYHSWWFQLLILILAINIIICSIDRLPAILKIVSNKPDFNIDRFRRYKNLQSFESTKALDSAETLYKKTFKKHFANCVVEPTDNGFRLFGEKGRWTRLGVYIVHASILLLLAGGMAGSIKGFEGTVKIMEGETADTVELKKNQGHIKLNFQIRCDNFDLSLYDTGAPKEYKSDLVIIENGKEVLKKSIIVNDPLRYKGINIFQSFYGSIPSNKVILSFTGKKSGIAYEKEVITNQATDLPEEFGSFLLRGYIPSYDFRGHNIGETFVGVITKPDGKTRNVILPLKYETFDKMFKPDVDVAIVHFEKKSYTGLQVTHDPGVFLVYSGFFFMIAGCFIAFFMSHQSMFMEVTKNGNNSHTVMISGSANKNKLGMTVKVKKIADSLQG